MDREMVLNLRLRVDLNLSSFLFPWIQPKKGAINILKPIKQADLSVLSKGFVQLDSCRCKRT